VDIPIRSWLTHGVATITAAAIAFVPCVEETAPAAPPPVVQIASPSIELAAQVQPAGTAAKLPGLLVDWLKRITVPPSAGQPFPTPQFPPAVGGTSIDSTIKNVYNAVEPWVRYGFELAAYAVGWVPYVGWLSPQIIIFYNFGERIARSITFNVADWLGGNVSFGQGLVNVGVDTVNSFIQLGIDELNFFLPPLPPLPPLPFAATQRTAVAATAAVHLTKASVTPTDTAPVNEKHSAVKGEELAAVNGAKGPEARTTAATTDTSGKAPAATGDPTAANVSTKGDKPENGKRATGSTGSSTPTGHQAGKRGHAAKK
jgi:hypothetical protein